MSERYAIYYAPAIDDPFWELASAWLGRDAASGRLMAQPPVAGLDTGRQQQATRSARRYGFHATLKAPMRLAPDITPDDLVHSLERFSSRSAPLVLGCLTPRNIDGFLALMPGTQEDELAGFAAQCVTEFDTCRAPLSPTELQRRMNDTLTDRQKELVAAYGYPYVLEEFRLHMTLSDRLDPETLEAMRSAASEWFAPVLERHVTLDRLVLFREDEPGAPFRRVRDFPLAGVQ